MFRGYKCKHKSAETILETLGYDPHDANRGWTLNRTGGKNNQGAPIRMHAMIHIDDDGTQYIDVHADHHGPKDTHITQRGKRTERWNEIFRQIDHDEECDAGNKLLAHYGPIREALEEYHEARKRT